MPILHGLRSTYWTTVYVYQMGCMRRRDEKVLPVFLYVLTTASFSPHTEWEIDQHRMYHCWYPQFATINLIDSKWRYGHIYIYVSFLSLPDEGTNVFEIVYKSNKVWVACVDNVYKDVKTRFAIIFGMCDTYSHRNSHVTFPWPVLLFRISTFGENIHYVVYKACLFVQRVKDPGTKSTNKKELVQMGRIRSSAISNNFQSQY